jgi:hypothetical protein
MTPDETILVCAHKYLGDGLYAGWDGNYCWLMANVNGQLHALAMDHPAFLALSSFIKEVNSGNVEPKRSPR